MNVVLNVVNLVLQRGEQRWAHDFSVPVGGSLALMGPSGSGKTTVLEALGGFVPVTSGEIYIGDQAVQAWPAERRPVSTLFQNNNLFEHISVRANLRLGFARGKPSAAEWDRLEAACYDLGISGLMNRQPGEISGGQRQRVALVRTVLRPQPVVLLDEPFSALDGDSRERAGHWLRETVRSEGKALVFVTHQQADATLWADEVIDISTPSYRVP